MGRFLSKEDLERLTGYKRAAEQRKWLIRNDYKFDVRCDGRPALLWERVETVFLEPERKRVLGPNLDALD
jgi:hypothetical protein